MPGHRRLGKGRGAVFLSALWVGLALASDPASGPVFPQGAQPGRLAFVTEIRGNHRFQDKRSLLGKLADLLTGGADPVLLVRPHGVGAGPDVLLVADAGAGCVHRYNLADSTWSRLPREGRLRMPVDAAEAPDGTVLVADADAGEVLAFGLDGKQRFVCEGPFVRPAGLAYDPVGRRFLVADPGAHRVIVLGTGGQFQGELGARGEGPGSFNFPIDVCALADGSLLVLDALNFRIQRLDAGGEPLGGFGEQGDKPGYLARPRGVAADPQGRIYVTDALQDHFQVYDADGRLLLAVGGQGRGPGTFWMPAGIAVDPQGRIFVADAYNCRVQVFAPLDPAPGGGE